MTNESTEKQFRYLFKDRKDVWIRKLRVDKSSTPFDYLLLTNNKNYAIELKEWKSGKYFYCQNRISPHQIAGLINFSKVGDNFESFIIIHAKEWYIIPINCWDKNRKKYSFDELKMFEVKNFYNF